MVGVVLRSVLLQLLYKRQREEESMEVVQTVDKGRRLCMEWTLTLNSRGYLHTR